MPRPQNVTGIRYGATYIVCGGQHHDMGSAIKEAWLEKIRKQRKGADPRGLLSHMTLDDIDIQTLYVDSETHKMAFSSLPWTRCQSYNHMNPVELNQSILHDLKGGTNGIWLDMDTGRDDMPAGDGASLWNLECWDQALPRCISGSSPPPYSRINR